jgi:hypothetical protein
LSPHFNGRARGKILERKLLKNIFRSNMEEVGGDLKKNARQGAILFV